jgi:transposase InsO family protein
MAGAARCLDGLTQTLIQGSQFTSQAFVGLLQDRKIAISMDGRGAWRDNVFVERTIAYLNQCRRLAKDWKCRSRSALAFLPWAFIQLMLSRSCQKSQ